MGVFAKLSGLYRLSEHYPVTNEPTGVRRIKQTVKFGVVRYRGCVTVCIGKDGLYLWVHPPLGKGWKLLIPWDEIGEVKGRKLYGRWGVHMSIGDPEVGEITMYRELFEVARVHLSSVAQVVRE